VDPTGKVTEAGQIRLDRASDWCLTATLPESLATADSLGNRLLVADADGFRATWLPAFDAVRREPAAAFAIRRVDGGVEIEAETAIRDLCVLAELADPLSAAGDGMRTLLPGERIHVPIEGGTPSLESLRAAVRSANGLSGRAVR
jgi:hypothetical protein